MVQESAVRLPRGSYACSSQFPFHVSIQVSTGVVSCHPVDPGNSSCDGVDGGVWVAVMITMIT